MEAARLRARDGTIYLGRDLWVCQFFPNRLSLMHEMPMLGWFLVGDGFDTVGWCW